MCLIEAKGKHSWHSEICLNFCARFHPSASLIMRELFACCVTHDVYDLKEENMKRISISLFFLSYLITAVEGEDNPGASNVDTSKTEKWVIPLVVCVASVPLILAAIVIVVWKTNICHPGNTCHLS